MAPHPPMWTREQLEEAKELWLSGKSASVVGKAVGKSTSAVIGKMKRLGIHRRSVTPTTIARINLNRKVVRPGPQPRPEAEWPATAGQHPVRLPNLKPHHCRAILGDVGVDGAALYCGDPKAEGSSYCPHHKGLFVQPLKERLRQWPSRPT